MAGPEKPSEPPLPWWTVPLLPLSAVVAAVWGPASASGFCAVAAVVVLYRTSARVGVWHLGAGALLCACGAGAVIHANYLLIRTDTADGLGRVLVPAALLWFLGQRCFTAGRRVRLTAQLSLSRLRRHRADHGLPPPAEAPGALRPGPRTSPFWRATVLGGALCGLGWLCFCFALHAAREFWATGEIPWWGPPLAALQLALAVALTGLGNSVLRLGVQHYEKVITSPHDLTPGGYVLYLRSFGDDHRLARPHRIPLVGGWLNGWITLADGEEERIGAALSWAGPLVGVGAPGERVPRAGARRMYLPRDGWQDDVRTMMRHATLVVIVLGTGPGTLWEIGEAMRVLPPERLLFLVPMKERAYEEFRTLAADRGLVTLPPYERSRVTSRVRGIVHLTPDGRPRFVPLRWPPPLEDRLMGALDRALWPVAVQLTARDLATGGTG